MPALEDKSGDSESEVWGLQSLLFAVVLSCDQALSCNPPCRTETDLSLVNSAILYNNTNLLKGISIETLSVRCRGRSVEHSLLHSIIQYRTEQYSTVQYSTVQYSTVHYSTLTAPKYIMVKKVQFDPGAVLDRVISSAEPEDECYLYKLADFKKSGQLVDAFNTTGSKVSSEQC